MNLPDLTQEQSSEQLAQWKAAYNQHFKKESRLAIPYHQRLPLCASLSFLTGFAVGMTKGSNTVGLQYRAENAHRLPQSPAGWYLYHKTKNYAMAWGGLRAGVAKGGAMTFWTAAFLMIENSLDLCRGSKDFLNTMVAGVSVAGAFARWRKFLLARLSTVEYDRPC